MTRLLKEDVPFSFNAEMEAVVREILKVLTKPPVLVYPDFEAAQNGSRKFRLYCDASAAGFGATLEQPQKDNSVRPIVYLSRTVLPNEQGWAPIEKEAGCIVWAIKRLRQYLLLIPFDTYTDHLPLTSLPRVGVSNARVQRWVEFLTAYNYRIIHRKGAAHGNANMLSRLCQPATQADAQGSCSITNPEDHAVYFVGASGMWPRSIPPSAFNVFIETGSGRQKLGVGGLLNAPDYSYDKSRNQYVYHGHEHVENHVLHNPPSTWHSLCKRVLRQKELPICTVQRYCNSRTAMVAAVVAAQCKPQQSPVPLRRSPRKRRPSRVMIEAMESSARNELLASIDEPNRTSEEGDTREIDVGTEQIIATEGSTKDGATIRSGDHNLASPDGEEPLIDDIDVGEDATHQPNPSRTQQDIPDVSRDARLDVDLGSMTAQKWSQEQLQEPVCKSTITLLQQGLGGASPHDITLQFPIRVRPTVQQVLELAAKTKLFTTEGKFPLLVKRNTSSAELSQSGGRVPQIYVPMLMRPRVLRGCHADSVCHFGVTRTLQMLQRFYWWVGLDQSVRWWIRRCLFCQARKTSRQTIRWPTTLMPLPSGPGQIVSVDYFGPLPITRNGNKHILLYTDRFSRRIAAYAVTQDERTAEGTARIFVEQYIPLWGCPHTLLSDNGSEFVARLSLAIYKLMRIRKIATTAFHPKRNGGVERVNHSLAQMLSLVISEQQDDWDEWLPYVVQAYNNSVSAATGLAPNEIHLGRMPRLPMTVIDECVVKGHTVKKQDQLLYLDIVRERQQRAFELVQESYLIAM